ncbi:hypothetical protein [Paraburkholderia sp.]|uniref:hypothetical protein n=1 Tax=Paraburkholderia sp. TaxID=1926495 RepID=UPI0039E2F445
MIQTGPTGTIVKAINSLDGSHYGSSIIAARKRVRIPLKLPEGPTGGALAAALGRDMTFDVEQEAAVWRGDIKPLSKPLLVIQLTFSTKQLSQEEFGAVVETVLTNGDLSESGADDLEQMLHKWGFRSWRHVLRTFPLMKKIPVLCVQAIDPDDEHDQLLREMGWDSSGGK